MDPFALAVNGWHDFYMMVGTASATLLGLLFVSLSLNADAIAKPENADLRALAEQTFSTFLYVLSFAILFLIPSQKPVSLGIPLIALGAYGLYSTYRHYRQSRVSQHRIWRKGGLTRRFIVPVICFIVLIIIGISIIYGSTNNLYWLISVMILLLILSSINAWDLLLKLREPRNVE